MGNLKKVSGGIDANIIGYGVDGDVGVVLLEVEDMVTLASTNFEFIQTDDATEKGVAVHRWGGIIIPTNITNVLIGLYDRVDDVKYFATLETSSIEINTTLTFESGE